MKKNSLHIQNYNRHKEHNERVTEFHRNHAFQIANGQNGTGWLAKLERFVYNKGISLFKTAK